MDRFVARNYGSSRNLPDGHGSYIFMERDSARETNDEDLAKLFAGYPDVEVRERGQDLVGILPAPPVGPEPLGESEDQLDEVDVDSSVDSDVESEDVESAPNYQALLVKDLQEIAKEREIPTNGLLKADLVKALEDNDATTPEAPTNEWRVDQPVKYEDEDEIYHIVSVPEEADGKFILKNTEQKEYSALAGQLTPVE